MANDYRLVIYCNEVSSKILFKPSGEVIKSDLLIYLKWFLISVYSKYHALEGEKANKATHSGDKNSADKSEGLGTGLRPTNGWTPDNNVFASRDVEAFLYEVEQKLLNHLDETA